MLKFQLCMQIPLFGASLVQALGGENRLSVFAGVGLMIVSLMGIVVAVRGHKKERAQVVAE